MEVYALVGPSGTGKSHRALNVALDHEIEVIVDDGLLIHKNKIIAGQSAKAERLVFKAVKKATFFDPRHAGEVRAHLSVLAPHRLLILGTSLKMIGKICQTLQLPYPAKFILIQDIASPHEMRAAREARLSQGKHVIPVPTMEVQRKLPGFWAFPLRILLRQRQGNAYPVAEKTIVRPPFTPMGKLDISPYAIMAIATAAAERCAEIARVSQADVQVDEGLVVNLHVHVYFGANLSASAREVQNRACETLEQMTWLQVRAVNVTIKGVTLRPADEKGSSRSLSLPALAGMNNLAGINNGTEREAGSDLPGFPDHHHRRTEGTSS
ncbi:MAG: Asp23/Gls24 family envelope stress response protein [Firmicutes bacterium]|nr:Asp23/Gls24 family envelope stress response protein [Bacillota bacterium]